MIYTGNEADICSKLKQHVMTLCQVWSWGRRPRDVHNDFIMTIEKEGINKKDGDVMVEMVM